MSVVQFPVSGLTESDFEALRREWSRRRDRTGHVARGFTSKGHMWAAIRERPDGPPLHHFCREQGVYYVLDFSGGGAGRLVDAGRDFAEILKHLPARPPGHRR